MDIANNLRRSGWPVSTSELEDFFQALQVVDFNSNDVLSAMLSTMAKDRQGQQYLETLFNQLLNAGENDNRCTPRPLNVEALLKNPPRLSQEEFASRVDDIKNSIRREVLSIVEAYAGARSIGITGMGLKARQPGNASSKPVLSHQHELSPDLIQKEALFHVQQRKPGATNLRYLDIAKADADQLDEINKMLVALGKKLAVHRGYRKKPATTGTVNMRGTVKAAVARGGVPLVLKKERRIPSSPQLVVLCDLSGSVAPYSEFFLQLLAGLSDRFKSLRSFAFVDHVEEITEMLKNTGLSWHQTAQKILREARISRTGFSNYGAVWEQFHRYYQQFLDPRSTLIILGDAKNNWQPDGLEYFYLITAHCRRTIWLNPMPRDRWNAGDCIIDKYAHACTSVMECRNALQLSRVIREIL